MSTWKSLRFKSYMSARGDYVDECWLEDDHGRPIQLLETRVNMSTSESIKWGVDCGVRYHHLTINS